jgi:type I restriction enzyme S subunit
MKLKQYPEYKEVKLPWINKLPIEWKVLRAKNIFKPIDIRSETGEEELLSVSEKKGVSPRKNINVTMFKAESYKGYKLCWPGDLVINSLWAWMQGLGFSKYHGIISTAYGVYRLKNKDQVEYKYFDYLFRSSVYLWELRVRSKGIWRSRYQLTDDAFMTMPVIIPSNGERKRIVRFLDFKCAQIAKFIRNKHRLIKLLKEQKQAIINQAVTRGINPNVKIKPGGVEWLGDIPENWTVFQLKRIAKFNPSKSELSSSIVMPNIVVFLPMEAVSVDGKINCKENRKVSEIWNGFTYFKKGDVVVAKITPCFENGKGAHLDFLATNFGFGTTEFIVIRPSEKIYGGFLYFITMTSRFRKNGEEAMTGAAGQKRVPTDFMKNYIVALPNIEEQLEILNFIKQKNIEIDRTIKKTKTEIELIQEYRTRLISDVVTGKLDVRNIKVNNISDKEINESLSINEEMQDLNNSIKEVSNEH